MTNLIAGVPVCLLTQVQTGTDPFNRPIMEERAVTVENVLIAPLSDEERATELNLTGRRAVYQLGIPKGDTHNWQAGTMVEFFGQRWRIIGEPTQGIEAMIPLKWNKKVKVESVVQSQV